MNPASLSNEYFKYTPYKVNMTYYDPYSIKITKPNRIPDDFIQKYPEIFLIKDSQKIVFMLKNQKLNVNSLDKILQVYLENNQSHLFFTVINLNNLEGDLEFFIEKYYDKIHWNYQNVSALTENQMIKYKDLFDWDILCYTKDLSKNLIEKCIDKINKKRLIECSNYLDMKLPDYLDKSFLEKMIN